MKRSRRRRRHPELSDASNPPFLGTNYIQECYARRRDSLVDRRVSQVIERLRTRRRDRCATRLTKRRPSDMSEGGAW